MPKKLFFGALVFNPVENKKSKPKAPKRKSGTKAYCICKQTETGAFYAIVTIIGERGIKTNKLMPFSENSYNLKGKTVIFTKDKKRYGQIARIHRTKQEAEHFPGSSDIYTPFRNNWIYSGYVETCDNVTKFDVSATMGHELDYGYLIDLDKPPINELKDIENEIK